MTNKIPAGFVLLDKISKNLVILEATQHTNIHSLARAIDTQQKLVFCGFHFSQTEANILPYHTTALTKEAY